MRKRSKNKGFTLIEVIIALAILAVALAPLTANFIVSSKMNLKSRKNLNAMNLAQDMMEGMRSYSASELIDKLNNNTNDPNPGNSLVGKVLPEGATYDITNSTVDTSDPSDLKYSIKNIKTTSVGGYNTYTVDVELIPDTGAYDGKDMAEIASVDPYYNPVYSMSTSNDAEDTVIQIMYDNLAAIGATGDKDKNDLKNDVQREINLEMKSTGTEADPAYSTTVEVVYKIKSGRRGAWGVASGPYTDKAEYRNSQSISKALPKDCPTAVYLYYTGYKTRNDSAPSSNDDDVINITNQTGQDITVYLIRTQDATHPESDTYHSQYKCRVNLTATNPDGSGIADNDAPGWIYLVTNVRYNLSKGEEDNKKKYPENSSEPYVAGDTSTYYLSTRAHIYYNSTTQKIVESDYQECISDGYQKSDKGLLYKVKLTITDDNGYTIVYDGGTVN